MKKQDIDKAKRTHNIKIPAIGFSLGLILLAGIAVIFYFITRDENKAYSEYKKTPEPAFTKTDNWLF